MPGAPEGVFARTPSEVAVMFVEYATLIGQSALVQLVIQSLTDFWDSSYFWHIVGSVSIVAILVWFVLKR